jgi:hypothetical protein
MVRTGKSSNLNIDGSSLYIAAVYFVFTSLSTVGYGDVVGTENIEYIFQIFVLVLFTIGIITFLDHWYWLLCIYYG